MMMPCFALFGIILVGGIYLQGLWIRLLRNMNVLQVFKKYGPKSHIEGKKDTPTMGGVVFILLGILTGSFLFFKGYWTGHDLFAVLGFPVAGGLIGLVDDILKYARTSSEGFRSLQKLFLQLVAGIVWAFFYMGDGKFDLAPGLFVQGVPGYLILVFILVGALNAVNITDGLDGLASGACAISFAGYLIMVPGCTPATMGSLAGLGISLGFLRHNINPAKVFMGDCGSHFLGGLLVSVCVAGGFAILIVPLGFLMGLEVLSVIIQIVSIRLFGVRVFKMSPIHHHFEILGWTEKRVVKTFWVIHLAGMVTLLFLVGILIY